MSDFKIIKLNNEPYDFLIIATSSESPLNNLTDVANLIDRDEAFVIFDLTLINGVNSNRYMSGQIEDGLFNMTRFNLVTNIDQNVRELSKSFFMQNLDIVNRSVVSNPLKHLIQNGLV